MVRILAQRVAALLLGLGLVFAGLEMGSSGTGVPRAQAADPVRFWAEGEMPQYPAMEFPLGDGLAVNGVPVRISYYQAKSTVEEVRDFYLQAFEARGLVPIAEPGVQQGWTVTALAEDGRSEIVVPILSQGRGRALVFPSIVPLGSRPSPEATAAFTRDLPLGPGAMGLMVVSAKDKPGEAIVTYQEPTEAALAVAGRIRDELGRAGWTLERFEQARPDGIVRHVVEATRGGARRQFAITPWPGQAVGAAVAVQVSAR